MLEQTLLELERPLATVAHRHGWDDLVDMSGQIRGIGSEPDVVLVAAPRRIDTSEFTDWIGGFQSGSILRFVCFDDLVADPWPIFKAQRLLGVFECGRIIESQEAETINRFFFARLPESYAFVLQRAEILQTAADLDSMRRIAGRMLVSPDRGPSRPEELSRYGVYFWSSAGLSAPVQDAVRSDHAEMRNWFSRRETDLDNLRRQGALYVLNLARQRLEGGATESAKKPEDFRAAKSHRAIAMLEDLERRLKNRWEADIRLLAREIAADIERLTDKILVSSEGADSIRHAIGEGPESDAARQRLVDFIRKRIHQTNEMSQVKIGERLAMVCQEMLTLVTESDWSSVNHWLADRGEKLFYPEALSETLVDGLATPEFSTAPQRIVESETTTQSNFAGILFPTSAGAFVGGTAGWTLAGLMHLYFKLHILRAVAGSAGAIAGALIGILVASRNRSAAQFESSARHSVRESLLQIRDGASEAVLKLLGSPVFEEWSGRISKLAQRIAATADPDEPSIAGSGDADDLRIVEVAIERLSTDDGAEK